MKILHLADLHLGSRMETRLSKEKAELRRQELLYAWQKAVTYAAEHEVGTVLIAGDLFDTEAVSRITIQSFLHMIQKHTGIGFYYLRGNHDQGQVLTLEERLPENLHLFREDWTGYALSEQVMLYGREAGTMVPALSPQGRTMRQSTAEEAPRGEESGENREGAGAEARVLTEETENPFAGLRLLREKINLVLLHGTLLHQHSLSVGTGKMQEQGAFQIPLPDPVLYPIEDLALGHIHQRGSGSLSGRGSYCYPGCLEGRGFDEPGEHGFTLLSIDEDRHELRAEQISQSIRQHEIIPVDVSGCENSLEMADRVRSSLLPCRRENLVRVLLRGELPEEAEKNLHFLTESCLSDFFYGEIRDETRIRAEYRKYRYDESLRGEFVRLVEGKEELSEEFRGEILRKGLELLQGSEA